MELFLSIFFGFMLAELASRAIFVLFMNWQYARRVKKAASGGPDFEALIERFRSEHGADPSEAAE